MADTATDYTATANGSQSGTQSGLKPGNRKGKKRPNTKYVGASSAELSEGRLTFGVENSPTKWGELPINSTFSKSKVGLPICVKISTSSYVEVFNNRRENGIAGGEVFIVHQK